MFQIAEVKASESYLKNEEGKESKSCVLSLVIWISSQPGFLAERENEGAEEEGCRWRE